MSHSIYMAYAGMQSQAQALEAISHNLANLQSTGFKQTRFYYELLSTLEDESLTPLGEAINSPQVRTRMVTDFSGGSIEETGNPLDFALLGDGFFTVLTPQGVRYTRNGDFTLGPEGRLQTVDGFPVLGVSNDPQGRPILLPEGRVELASDGRLAVDGNEVGRLKIVAFADAGALMPQGGSLFQAQPGAQEQPPIQLNVVQGFIEQANVNAVKAVTEMVGLMRNFEMLSQAIRSLTRDVDQKLINELGRV